MLRAGTTTAEAKSGYGLTLESEIRMLEAIVRLSVSQPIELVGDVHGRARSARRVFPADRRPTCATCATT